MKKRNLKFVLGLFVLLLSAFLGNPMLLMAEGVTLPDDASSDANSGAPTNLGDGGDLGKVQSGESQIGKNKAIVDPDFYQKDVDSLITKVYPQSTPIDTISRKADSRKTTSQVFKWYSLGQKSLFAEVSVATTVQTTGNSTLLQLTDGQIVTMDDTLIVEDVQGYDKEGNIDPLRPLMLVVIGIEQASGNPYVIAANGLKNSSGDQMWLPAIPKDTRMLCAAKALDEMAIQTGCYTAMPAADENYTQKQAVQITQSTFAGLTKTEVNRNLTEMEEEAILNMKLKAEATNLFGIKSLITIGGVERYTTEGIWYQAGKDYVLGKLGKGDDLGKVIITDDDMVDFSASIFSGEGSGSKRKVMVCGKNIVSSLAKIRSVTNKITIRESVSRWNMEFRSFQTDFGIIDVIYSETFNTFNRPNNAFVLDSQFLSKRIFRNWQRKPLDLKTGGDKDADSVVISEVYGLALKMKNAHCRVELLTV